MTTKDQLKKILTENGLSFSSNSVWAAHKLALVSKNNLDFIFYSYILFITHFQREYILVPLRWKYATFTWDCVYTHNSNSYIQLWQVSHGHSSGNLKSTLWEMANN